MAREIAEIPEILARQFDALEPVCRAEARRFAAATPRLLITCARGSSDHAAMYLKHLAETRLGVPTASVGPSIGSVYGTPLKLEGAVCLTISQSGASPDLRAFQRHARACGARTLVLLNTPGAPLGVEADTVIPLSAGRERAVPATKSFVASLAALGQWVAHCSGDAELLDSLRRLPTAIGAALECEWQAAGEALASAPARFVFSRGPGLAIAFEAALKLKETCRLHAEGMSAAELLHGPATLAGSGLAALAFVQQDRSRRSVLDAVQRLCDGGATVFTVDAPGRGTGGPVGAPAPHPVLLPICQIVSCYRFLEQLARSLGHDPDSPPSLSKRTRTR